MAQRRRHHAAAVRPDRRRRVGLARVVDVLPARARGAARPAGARARRHRDPSRRRGRRPSSRTRTASSSATPPAATVRARYAVGCDGANSTVRDRIGVVPHDLGFFYDWLIVDVVLDEPRVFDPLNVQICDPGRPTTAVSGGPGRRRWEFMRLPHETREELNDEARAWELLAPWDVHPGNARLERHAVYTFNARYVEQWRVGRVLLAGDAAHQMPPFAGQGLCAGVRDAANLAWKLDLVLDGRAPDALLDTYGQERLPSARQAIEFSMELGKVICVPDPDEAAARDAGHGRVGHRRARRGAGAPRDRGGGRASRLHRTRVASSCRAPTAGARSTTCTAPAGGSSPWSSTADAIDPRARAWFASIGGRVVALTDPDPTYRRWFAEHGDHARRVAAARLPPLRHRRRPGRRERAAARPPPGPRHVTTPSKEPTREDRQPPRPRRARARRPHRRHRRGVGRPVRSGPAAALRRLARVRGLRGRGHRPGRRRWSRPSWAVPSLRRARCSRSA